jgi:hypothetical protein
MGFAKLVVLLFAALNGFESVRENLPAPEALYDPYANRWKLDDAGRLLVLPAQDATTWKTVHAGPWRFTHPDEYGYIWAASSKTVERFDPRNPAQGWEDFSDALPHGEISAMDTAPSGSILVAISSGKIVELDRTEKRTVQVSDAPAGITQLRTDAEGRIWAGTRQQVYRRGAAADAWQRSWEATARLPGSNHDLAGDVIGSKFYMAGGQTATWGFPVVAHVFDGLYEFEEPRRVWRTAAKLRHPRFYNGTAALDGKIWVIGGSMRDASGKAYPLATVEIFDPRTGEVQSGPGLPYAIEMPLAVHMGQRIYVAGNEKLISIGTGEQSWTTEPDMPPAAGLKALAGTAANGRVYVTIAKVGLAEFDPVKRAWSVVSSRYQPRSPQVAALQNEIWVMGGREIPEGRSTMVFDLGSRQWRSGPNLPRELAWGAAATVNGRLMITGGAAGRCYNNRTFLLR